jgi:hypothetical protein
MKNFLNGQKIIPVASNDLAKHGGILNCVTWNIKL